VEDLDRLFLALRERSYKDEVISEIGNFVAHRGQRDKGPVTQRVHDMATSARIWLAGITGKVLKLNDARIAATVKLRLASDDQLLSGCGMNRTTAETVLRRSFRKLDAARPLNAREVRVLSYLGNRFIWNPAFTEKELIDSFGRALVVNQIIGTADVVKLESVQPFITLYVIVLMHGSAIVLAKALEQSSLRALRTGSVGSKSRPS
jgi:hypothetical protein